MYSVLLTDVTFHKLLLAYDRDLADRRREAGCACGGALHSAKYPRKPRPWSLVRNWEPEHSMRFSFCCAVDGCRSRATPTSLRFLGRKVYLATIVVVMSVMCHGITGPRLRRLREAIGVDRHTIERWRGWWREAFTASPFWQIARASFMPRVDENQLPAALLDRFAGNSPAERMIALLRFLAPITAGQVQAM